MSRKTECPGCAMEIDADSDECPICGYDLPKQPLTMKIVVWLFVALILLWILF